jgi:hypothetical protein
VESQVFEARSLAERSIGGPLTSLPPELKGKEEVQAAGHINLSAAVVKKKKIISPTSKAKRLCRIAE